MSDVLTELISLLALERIEDNLFRGQSQDLGWGRVYGGQVLGQALSAAVQTVPEDRIVHSLHGYFLRSGDASKPIVYEVDRIRNGRSFTTRRVVAVQSGRPIFNMAASFQILEDGFEHQREMAEFPGPEGLPSERDISIAMADKIPPKMRARAVGERPIEIRPVDPINPLNPQKKAPQGAVWLRASRPVEGPLSFQQYLLAYASDFHFMTNSLNPHGESWLSPNMQVASLDHAMWFHRPFRMDEWLLHVVDSPSASGARGLVHGKIYTQEGILVASTAQEGLIRKRS